MENNLPTHVLSIELSCSCERCAKVLKKKILKMSGVDSVAVDTKNNLVSVVGKIKATTLVNDVAKLVKAVELVSTDEQKDKRNEGSSSKKKVRFVMTDEQKDKRNEGSSSKKKVEEKQEHICEAYVPPVIDPRVCRDFHCKTHPRGRVIVDRVPAENTSSFFGMGGLQMGDSRYYGGYNPYAGGSYQYPVGMQSGWYGQGPPPQYGYVWHPEWSRNLPQHPYTFQ